MNRMLGDAEFLCGSPVETELTFRADVCYFRVVGDIILSHGWNVLDQWKIPKSDTRNTRENKTCTQLLVFPVDQLTYFLFLLIVHLCRRFEITWCQSPQEMAWSYILLPAVVAAVLAYRFLFRGTEFKNRKQTRQIPVGASTSSPPSLSHVELESDFV
jgi:hypothetical protein